jgi:hypothetical protein
MTDWESRESVELARVHLNKLAEHLVRLKRAADAHSSNVEQRLDVAERRMEQLEAGLERVSKKQEGDGGATDIKEKT